MLPTDRWRNDLYQGCPAGRERYREMDPKLFNILLYRDYVLFPLFQS